MPLGSALSANISINTSMDKQLMWIPVVTAIPGARAIRFPPTMCEGLTSRTCYNMYSRKKRPALTAHNAFILSKLRDEVLV